MGRAGRKQWKIRRANGGKKHKSEPKWLRFVRETYVRNTPLQNVLDYQSFMWYTKFIGHAHIANCYILQSYEDESMRFDWERSDRVGTPKDSSRNYRKILSAE